MDFLNLSYLNIKIEEFKKKEYKTESVSEIIKDLEKFWHSFSHMTSNRGNCYVFRVREIKNGENRHISKREIPIPK